ncbi:HPr family phosphocarrier protein [Nocardiopsis sp. HNM0947]|uniref:Phosphocarrier protein HPr n=1 Tax=Nocardiopsis coralli TaxID=2772213 RepID=A0ABR9PF76_9ACTN|nr:HPr family phosphocarrier protein [Nocardiopsis coralli]MBE3002405.1 HPr family phosphocarrier protein [Nocardiopsis coralli]
MPQRTVAVAALLGLHARPATLFVQAAKETGLSVTIAHEGREPVAATSVLQVMAMGVRHGQEVTVACPDGDGAEAALDRLCEVLATDPDSVSG